MLDTPVVYCKQIVVIFIHVVSSYTQFLGTKEMFLHKKRDPTIPTVIFWFTNMATTLIIVLVHQYFQISSVRDDQIRAKFKTKENLWTKN